MPYRILLFVIFASCVLAPSLKAQTFSGGFRAGLNFMTFSGDQESFTNDANETMTVEQFKRTTGFHVGATFALAFTDLVGVKANFMYTQKGGEILFEGPSYFYLYNGAEDLQGFSNRATADKEQDVVNSYLEVPVLAYYKIGPFEVEGGLSAALLVNSRASGSIRYTNIESNIFFGEDLIFNFDENILRDGAGFDAIQSLAEVQPPNFSNVPAVVGAYYNNLSDEKLYRRLDFGAVVGVSVFLNNGLFVGVRYQHGLTDATDGVNDLRKVKGPNEADGREFNENDKDYNRVYQASVGFRF